MGWFRKEVRSVLKHDEKSVPVGTMFDELYGRARGVARRAKRFIVYSEERFVCGKVEIEGLELKHDWSGLCASQHLNISFIPAKASSVAVPQCAPRRVARPREDDSPLFLHSHHFTPLQHTLSDTQHSTTTTCSAPRYATLLYQRAQSQN